MIAFYSALIDEPDDKEKFARIYSAYREKMFFEAMKILNNRTLAEEAVQESLLRIAKNISAFSEEKRGRSAALMAVIVRNVSLNMLRAEHPDDKVPLDENMHDIPTDVLSRAVSDEGYGELLSAVKTLDSIYSDVLILRLVYGYGSGDISEMLGIPRRTAETRFYRGKKMLKEKLEELYGKQRGTE